jgi:hypothetical protein
VTGAKRRAPNANRWTAPIRSAQVNGVDMSMSNFQKVVSRNWPIWLLVALLGGSLAALIWYRADTNFGTISTVLGIVIGGTTTALTQVALQARDRALKREDDQLERPRQILEKRVERLHDQILESVAFTQKVAHHMSLYRTAQKNGAPEFAAKNRNEIDSLVETVDLKSELELRANVDALKSERVKGLVIEILAATEQIIDLKFMECTDHEFRAACDNFDRVSVTNLGTIFAELDKIQTSDN